MQPEEHIKRLIASGDTEALKIIFDSYYTLLCICSMRYLTDIADAEDIVQDVLNSFWTNKRGKEFEGSVRAYLFAAVSRAAHKYVSRKRTVRFDDVELFVGEQIERLLDKTDEEREVIKKLLETEINKLPQRSREVFNLVTRTNMSYRDVAEQLGITTNTVKTLYYNAVKKLRENIKDENLFLLMVFTSFFAK